MSQVYCDVLIHIYKIAVTKHVISFSLKPLLSKTTGKDAQSILTNAIKKLPFHEMNFPLLSK